MAWSRGLFSDKECNLVVWGRSWPTRARLARKRMTNAPGQNVVIISTPPHDFHLLALIAVAAHTVGQIWLGQPRDHGRFPPWRIHKKTVPPPSLTPGHNTSPQRRANVCDVCPTLRRRVVWHPISLHGLKNPPHKTPWQRSKVVHIILARQYWWLCAWLKTLPWLSVCLLAGEMQAVTKSA